jgi:hypothetical protein
MANQVEKVNGIEIGKIEKINGLTDAEIQNLNGLEFTGSTDAQLVTFATQDTGGSAIDGGTGFNGSGSTRSYATQLAFDPDTNQVIIAFSDNGNSTRCTIRIGTVSGTTITFGDKIVTDTSHTGVNATGCHYDKVNNRLIVIQSDPYSIYTGTGGIYATAFELDSSADRTVATQGTTTEVFQSSSGHSVSTNNLSEIQEHDGVVDVLYEDKGDGDDNYVKTVRINDASACSLTISSGAEFDDDSNNYFGIAYSPDEDKNLVIYVDGNTLKGRTITHFSGNPSVGSNVASFPVGYSELDVGEGHGGRNMIYDTEHNKFHFIFRYNSSNQNNAVNDNLYISNASISGTTVTFANTGNPTTTMNNTLEISDLKYGSHHSSNQAGGGLIYSHQRQRIIMHGNSSNSETGSTKKFHVIDYNGSSYTKSSSPIDIFTASGAPWDTGAIRTGDESGTFGTVNLISYMVYGGSNDGKTFIQGIDAGDSTIS